ncbi:conserved hypothetical protein [Histoplasma capsulatum G186AR]|uniref:Uncharacterized protein n=1 Tax=Ajellomyces capsulatus (strain G186AR / H82 / ATCC MYA-2454 / RMSCC 2432) TaxID=447093 RepID=C0NZ89_AJECG|nr:uncharacterized protein HCBG_08469 [Histoplasma capsulatum G186AR]EEH03137.1 conserved hypothetical protein [Histoplasma capsulatum G186AR]
MDAKLNFNTLKTLAARVPRLLKISSLHVFKRSPAAGKQDLQVEFTVNLSLIKAIGHRKEGHETYDVPLLADVEAEWTGHWSGVNAKSPQPDVSEEKFKSMMAEVKEDVTILYLHGCAYYLMDPMFASPYSGKTV